MIVHRLPDKIHPAGFILPNSRQILIGLDFPSPPCVQRHVRLFPGLVPQNGHYKIPDIVHAVMDNDSSIYSKVVEFGNFHIINRLFPDGGGWLYPNVMQLRIFWSTFLFLHICWHKTPFHKQRIYVFRYLLLFSFYMRPYNYCCKILYHREVTCKKPFRNICICIFLAPGFLLFAFDVQNAIISQLRFYAMRLHWGERFLLNFVLSNFYFLRRFLLNAT